MESHTTMQLRTKVTVSDSDLTAFASKSPYIRPH